MTRKTEIILGIDPGTVVLGYGLLKIENNKPELIEMGVLKLSKYKDANIRLQLIYNKVAELHRVFKPTMFAIEAPFFGKVAIASAMQAGISATEYSPKKIKQSITGNGNATKEQVWKMLQQILKFKDEPEFLDATDAVAVALCHFYQSGSVSGNAVKYSGWDNFLKENANRIKKP